MIQNLNQTTFQNFGTILPEKAQSGIQDTYLQILHLTRQEAQVYRCTDDCQVCRSSGMTVLSVSADNRNFRHFYLDKPAWIRAGIYFSLTPFPSESSVRLAAASAPESVSVRDHSAEFLVRSAHRADSIFTFFYQTKEPGFLFPGEAHPMYELTYVDQGSLHSTADGRDLLLQQGDLVIYGPGQWHVQYADMEIAPQFVTISFESDGDALDPLLNRKFRASSQIVNLLQQMLQEQEQANPLSRDMMITLLNMILLHLRREVEAPGDTLQPAHSLHSENEIIRHAQQYVSTHVREKLSVPLLARKVDVSPSYLTALFHKHLQISPGEYIRRVKLQESKQMIRENSMNFTQIAAALHYSTVHHFSRQFKEKYGITPSEYAKSVR